MGASVKVPKKVVIIDSKTGRVAHEVITVLNWLMEENIGTNVGTLDSLKPYNLIGYLDSDPLILGESVNGVPVVGSIDSAYRFDDCLFVMAGYATADQPNKARSLFLALDLPHLRYETLVHPNAYVSDYVEIGQGTVICPGAKIMPNVTIGHHVMIYPNAVIDSEATVSDFAVIGAGSYIGRNSIVWTCAYIEANVTICDDCGIGDSSVVRSGSVVYKSVADGITVIGNPAKPYIATMKMRKPFEVGM